MIPPPPEKYIPPSRRSAGNNPQSFGTGAGSASNTNRKGLGIEIRSGWVNNRETANNCRAQGMKNSCLEGNKLPHKIQDQTNVRPGGHPKLLKNMQNMYNHPAAVFLLGNSTISLSFPKGCIEYALLQGIGKCKQPRRAVIQTGPANRKISNSQGGLPKKKLLKRSCKQNRHKKGCYTTLGTGRETRPLRDCILRFYP